MILNRSTIGENRTTSAERIPFAVLEFVSPFANPDNRNAKVAASLQDVLRVFRRNLHAFTD
jgi:hypothetical protein